MADTVLELSLKHDAHSRLGSPMRPFRTGKIPTEVLIHHVFRYTGRKDPSVILGSSIGEDAALVSFGEKILVMTTDPVTGTASDLGWLSVHINANDVACRGAKPRWFLCDLLLPERSNVTQVDSIMRQVDLAAKKLGVAVVGGHTEVTPGLNRPIIVGYMVGTVDRKKFVTSSHARPGDDIIMTKSAGIEGTAVLAADFSQRIRSKLGNRLLSKARGLRHLISVVDDAMITVQTGGVHAMHDPTEGGLIQGVFSEKLQRIRELDDRPLTETRALEKRLVGNCRDFSLMLCAMLRHQGVPARARCGFATYFLPNHFEDHWICEYWNRKEQRWIMVDAQLDSFQRDKLGISFDPLDVPNERFLKGGKAWLLCRAQKADPDQFGIFDMRGLWCVRGNLIRDLGALNKIELLPWDSWGLIDKDEKSISEADMKLLDQAATITLADNSKFGEMQATYENNDLLRVPPTIRSYLRTGVQTIAINA